MALKKQAVMMYKTACLRPIQNLCKPPKWCKIETSLWRLKNGKKESHTGRKSKKRENQRVIADVQHRKYG